MRFIRILLAAALLWVGGGSAFAAITHVGATSTPVDNAALDDTAVRALTPVSGMAAGDLILVQTLVRNSTESISISGTGGQTWTAGTQRSTD